MKAIAETMKKNNDTLKFAETLIKNAGYLRWDKARVQTSARLVRTEGGEEPVDTTLLFVPFTLGNSTSAVLTVAINFFSARDTAYNIVYPQHYQQYGFDTTLPRRAWNSRHVFNMFAAFDNDIFETDSFDVYDGRIFAKNQDDTLRVKMITNTNGWGGQNRNTNSINPEFWQTDCTDFYVCAGLPNAESRTVVTDIVAVCGFISVCNTWWVEGGGGSGSGGYSSGDQGPFTYPGGGGGGGTPGGLADLPNIPICPVAPRMATENIDPCSPGWLPVPPRNGNTTTLNQQAKLWDDSIIIDYTVRPCTEAVLNQIRGLDSGTIAKIIKNLSGSLPGFDWEIREVSQLYGSHANANAQTDYSPGSPINHSITYLNQAKLHSATNISLARTIIHESVHAFMYDYFYNAPNISTATRDSILGLSYGKILKQFIKHKYNVTDDNIFHRLMVINFKNDIKNALKTLCPIMNINPSDLEEYCNDLAWGGLESTDAFSDLSVSEQQRVINRLNAELTNTTMGTGSSSIAPLGTRACN